MELPQIRFVTTSDGVSIAYWSLGSGPPLVITHNFTLNHAELEWTVPSLASFYRSLAEHARVIRYDVRTAGLSGRQPGIDLTTAAMGRDIAAVIDAIDAERVSLLAAATMGPVAIEYAALHPDQIDRLVLCDTYPAIPGSSFAKWLEAQLALLDVDPGGAMSGTLWRGIAPDDEVEAVLALHREGPRDDAADIKMVKGWDATEHLSSVEAPTLVLFARSDRSVRLEDAQSLVAAIPDAQLKTVEGTFAPYFADRGEVLGALGSFLGHPFAVPASGGGRVTTVVFTDLVASTELLARLGDDSGRAAMRRVEETTSALAAEHHGEVIKNLGDGSMLAFGSTKDALAFSVGLQEAMDDDSLLDVRIGMAAGEPIREGDDLHGAVVSQASRIADQGSAGEILLADSVRQLALGKGFSFEPAGEATLKGFDEPVRLWRVTGR